MAKAKKSKSFNYNLSAVLRVKEIKEKQEQEKFLTAEKHFFEEQKKEEEIKAFQQEKYRELRKIMDPGSTISNFQEVLMRNSHLDIVKEQVAEQARVKDEAERLKEEQRTQLVRAVVEKKVIERDKEKKKESWRKLMDKEQDKFLDDIATIGYSRQKREAGNA
jgi:flagellar export protein FliJ